MSLVPTKGTIAPETEQTTDSSVCVVVIHGEELNSCASGNGGRANSTMASLRGKSLVVPLWCHAVEMLESRAPVSNLITRIILLAVQLVFDAALLAPSLVAVLVLFEIELTEWLLFLALRTRLHRKHSSSKLTLVGPGKAPTFW